MLINAFNRHIKQGRLIRLTLALVLVFAAAHVALHDLEAGGGSPDGHDQCQHCRLNHVPVTSLPLPSLFVPLQLLVYLLPVAETDYQLSPQLHIQWARAPPLF